jgi:hypothetical protein
MSEETPLLQQTDTNEAGGDSSNSSTSLNHRQEVNKDARDRQLRLRRLVTGPLILVLLILMLAAIITFGGRDIEGLWLLRGDPHTAALRIISRWPVIASVVRLCSCYQADPSRTAT